MKQLKKTLLTLVALLAVTTGAWAQTETLLTTITPTAKEQASYSTANVATVSFSYTENGGSAYLANWGWWGYGWSATVTAAEGYTITKCIFYDDADRTATDSEAPFVVETTEEDKTPKVNGTPIKADTSKGIKKIEVYGTAPSAASGPEVTWTAATKSGTFTMPGGNVTLEPDYYPQATAEGAVTAATDAKATTDAPLVTIDETKLTGAKNLMYYVSTDATAPAYDAQGWTDVLPTAENYTEAATLYVWYYPVGTDEDGDEATATYSDGDICATALTVTLGAAPTYAVTLNAEGLSTDESAAWKVAKGTDQPAAFPLEGVTKGTAVTVTYTGAKKVIGVKAEKKTAPASTPLDNTTTAWTAGTYAVPAGGLTYSDAITVSGDVTLTLTEGTTLTLNKGISLAEGATLTVEGNGTMAVNGTNESTASTVAGSSGTLVLTSGTLNATGGNGQSLTINWSTDDLDDNTGASGGVAINGNVTVSGGTVTATGGNGGNLNTSAIGGGTDNNHGGNGGAAISGSVTVNGGTWTATNGSNGTYTSNGGDLGCSAGTGGAAVAGTVTDNRN